MNAPECPHHSSEQPGSRQSFDSDESLNEMYGALRICWHDLKWWLEKQGRYDDARAFQAAFDVFVECMTGRSRQKPADWIVATVGGFYLEFSSAQHLRGVQAGRAAHQNLERLDQELRRLRNLATRM